MASQSTRSPRSSLSRSSAVVALSVLALVALSACGDPPASAGPTCGGGECVGAVGGGGSGFGGDAGSAGGEGSNAGAGGSAGSATPTGGGGGAPAEDFCVDGVVRDRLTDGVSSGSVKGGAFVPGVGWQTTAGGDQIVWDLGKAIGAGSVELEVTGLHPNVAGCAAGRCYFVGVFASSLGDKGDDYGAPFIESRYHTNEQENYHDVFKLQTGIGNGNIDEPMTSPIGLTASQTLHVRITWGPDPVDLVRGKATLAFDGKSPELDASYEDHQIPWRWLFVGTTNYKGWATGAIGASYKNVCLRSDS